jgi:branched-chain amino acid transport system permease protein
MIGRFVGIAFDGVAYGSLLFLISVGLSVTMGLMRFVNLAHGAFAMLGGYLAVALMSRAGVPFLFTLPIVFVASGGAGALLERALYRRLYRRSELDQVLFSIGVVFVSVAAATRYAGAGEQRVELPPYLRGQVHLLGFDAGRYRLFLIALVVLITLGMRHLVERTRFGARIRAAVDDPQVAAALGINVGKVFAATFALGAGLAGLGGALSIDVLGLDPTFPLKYIVYFLLVVTVGGAGSIKGNAAAALLLGIVDVAGKYYIPQVGAFIIYAAMVVLLLAFPAGLLGRRAP